MMRVSKTRAHPLRPFIWRPYLAQAPHAFPKNKRTTIALPRPLSFVKMVAASARHYTAPSHFSLVTRPLVIWKCNETVTGHGYLQNAALAAQATDPLLQSRKQWNPSTLLIIYTACRPACMHINCSQLTGGKWFKSVHLCVERAINMTLRAHCENPQWNSMNLRGHETALKKYQCWYPV